MDPLQRIHEVFDEALQRPADERVAFVATACGDDAGLRAEVESLLAHDSNADDGFLRPPARDAAHAPIIPRSSDEQPALGGADRPADHATAPDESLIGRRIGRYHIKSVIGTGGMATVYEAVQESPKRVVALKVLRRRIASKSALRRFEFESQTLARLRHKNIAQVFEAGMFDEATEPRSHEATKGDADGAQPPPAGTTDSELKAQSSRLKAHGSKLTAQGSQLTADPPGVPYFAMEYIPGARPITQFADEKRLPTRRRLELFATVCDAVHHGHQRAIIHRDLKPANILVDSAGEPKVIDFGVARATDSDLAVTTQQTCIGQLVGTMQYMSPEQCAADPHDLDIRSDVYSLGVVLFELLTGELPYEATRTTIYAATRAIQEATPPRPSTLVAQRLRAARRKPPRRQGRRGIGEQGSGNREQETPPVAADPRVGRGVGRVPPAEPDQDPERKSEQDPERERVGHIERRGDEETERRSPGARPFTADGAQPPPAGAPEADGSPLKAESWKLNADKLTAESWKLKAAIPPRELRGDLDTIVLKTLEKDRDRRYASAADLGQDIRRHLSGDPIEARPPTPWTRVVHWVRRHPIGFTAAVSLIVGIGIGLAAGLGTAEYYVSTYQLDRPDRIELSPDGQVARLLAVNGQILHEWPTPPNAAIAFAGVVDSPSGAGQLAVLGFDRAGSDSSSQSTLWAFDPNENLRQTVWESGVETSDLPPTLRNDQNLRGVDFGVNWGRLFDVFPEPAGKELVVAFSCNSWRLVRVYDLEGNVLYQFLHDGSLRPCYWISTARLLVFAGHNSESREDPSPEIAFAVRPALHLPWDRILRPQQDREELGLRWYRQLLPTTVADLTDRWYLTHPQSRHTGRALRLVVVVDEDLGASVGWDIDEDGEEIPGSRDPTDEYLRNRHDLPVGHPDRLPDPGNFKLGAFPAIRHLTPPQPDSQAITP